MKETVLAPVEEHMVSPDRHVGMWLGNHLLVSSTLITILTGLLLQLTHIIDVVERIDSWFTGSVTVRLIDVGFRMTMGAILIFLLVPLLFGYWRQAPWLRRYLIYMRISLGTSPRKTVSATILSLVALVLIMIGFSVASGVFNPDLMVLVADDQWIILFLALVPGIWEELAFRGVILSNLQQRYSPWAAVVISSVFFGLFHLSNLGVWADAPSVVAGVILATILGIGWGYLVVRSNSILPAVFLHYMIDVLLAADTFRDPFADDASFQLMALGIMALWPPATILITRIMFGKQHGGRSGAPRAMELAGHFS